jgi:membrane protease YdiL (CAAX protease family)
VARRLPLSLLLLAGFAVATWLRIAVGGMSVATSVPAGLVFAAVLAGLAIAAGTPFRPSWRAAGWGVGGAAVLLLPPLLGHLTGPSHPPAGAFLPWAAVVSLVATAEEAFLRGALFDTVEERWGPITALLVTSVCFAALHIPLYGWRSVPLDLAAGLWLGALRRTSGTWIAPALCHTLADLAAWPLR